jgi:hypothetical protein
VSKRAAPVHAPPSGQAGSSIKVESLSIMENHYHFVIGPGRKAWPNSAMPLPENVISP